MTHKHTYSIPSADDQNDARCIECGQLQPTTHTTKHTPGPWVVSIGPPEHVRISPIKTRIIPADGRDMIIATAEYGVYGPRNPMEAEANANLIAAAPAMYALIKDMRQAFYVDGKRKALLAVMERSHDVVAQAEGRQPQP